MNNNSTDVNTVHYQDLAVLARLEANYQQVYARLSAYPQANVIYTLSNDDICAALTQVMQGMVDIDELEMWASLLEIRGDIDHSQVEGGLYALANPDQMGELTLEKVGQMLTLLTEK